MRKTPAFVLLAVLVCTSALAGPPPEDGTVGSVLTPEKFSPEDFAQFKAMGLTMSRDEGPTKGGTRATELDPAPPPADLTPEAVKALTNRLAQSFFFGMRMDKSLTIEGDLWMMPALSWGTLDVKWLKVVGAGGKNVLGKPSKDDLEQAAQMARFGGGRLTWASDGLNTQSTVRLTVNAERPGLVKAEGKAKYRFPTAWTRLELVCKAGAKATGGGGTVTVRRCENDFLQLDWSGTGEPVVVIRDAAGHSLHSGGSSSTPIFTGGKTPAELEYKQLPATVEAVRLSFNVSGKVAAALLALPTAWAEGEVAITATPEPEPKGRKPLKVAVGRGLWEPPGVTASFVTTTAVAVKSGTRVVASRSYAMMEYNQPEVQVCLPRLGNSLFAKMEFTETTVLDKAGKPLEHGEDRAWVQWPDLCDEVRFSNPAGEGPLAVARAKGTVTVTYPVAMRLVTLSKAAPADGALAATFAGARVTITGEGGSGDGPELSSATGAPASFDLVRAYDKNGERLRALRQQEWDGDGHALTFWGEPAEVRLLVADAWDKVELTYDLPAAPLLPAGREGVKP